MFLYIEAMKRLLFILLLHITTVLCAQESFNAGKVDAIVYDDSGNYTFYHKLKNGNYRSLDLYFDDEKPIKDTFFNFLSPYWLEDDDEYSEEEILEDNTEMIFTKDISKTSFRDFVGQTYWCETPISSEEEEKGHIICEMVNNHSAVVARIANKIPTYGFGEHIIDTPEDTPCWLTFDEEQYAILVLKLKDHKQIYLFIKEHGDLEKIFIPMGEKVVLLDEARYTFRKVTSETYNLKNYRYSSRDFDDYFEVFPKGKKYEILDIFKNKALLGTYDSITRNHIFIITKNKEEVSIYNQFFQKLNCGKVKSARFVNLAVEVENEQGIKYYDSTGKDIPKSALREFNCGTR